MFEYTRKNNIYRVVFNTFKPKVVDSASTLGMTERKKFYGDIEEEFPIGMTEPLGKRAHMTCFVDDNHASNVFTMRSHIGV